MRADPEDSAGAFRPVLEALGVACGPDVCIEPLAGGVSSDIARVTAGHRTFVVKRALPKLKVAADWRAPIERSRYEVAWLQAAERIVPEAVPEVLAHDPASGLFAMSYLDPATYPVWKAELRGGR